MPASFVEQASNAEFWAVTSARRVGPFPTNEAAWRQIDRHTDHDLVDNYNTLRIAFSMCGAQLNSPRRTIFGITRKAEMMTTNSNNLPAIVEDDDGFGNNDRSDRLIQGEIAKCVDGRWSLKDGTELPPGTQRFVMGTGVALQLWNNQLPVETITKRPLPDINELNAAIPQENWEVSPLDGKPRPPWVKQFIVYLIDPADASILTFISSTTGARIAVERLQDKVQMMRALRGSKVMPIVELTTKAMKTRFGQKMRPDFKIVSWREPGSNAQITSSAVPAIEHVGKPVKPVTTREEFSDEIPW
jgi:hypothetical protein